MISANSFVRPKAYEESPKQTSCIPIEAIGLIRAVDFCDPKKKKIVSKLKYLTQVSNVPVTKTKEITIDDIESAKLFEYVESRTIRINKLKSRNVKSNNLSPLSSPKNGGRELADFIINNLSHNNKSPKFAPILLDDEKPLLKEDRLEVNITPKSPFSPSESFTSPMMRNIPTSTAVESPKFLELNQSSYQNKSLSNSNCNTPTARIQRKQTKRHTYAHKGNRLEVPSPFNEFCSIKGFCPALSKAGRFSGSTLNKQEQVVSSILTAKDPKATPPPSITIHEMTLMTKADSEVSSAIGSPKNLNPIIKQRRQSMNVFSNHSIVKRSFI